MQILMKELEGKQVLAGAIPGQKAWMKLIERTSQEPLQPEPVFLDFKGVDVARASYLREAILNFRNTVRQRRSNFYPIIANANAAVIEELTILLDPRGDVLMLCALDEGGEAHAPQLLGKLDPKQRFTFALVRERGETDASELMQKHGDKEGVKQTAWNNRLASLAGLGLIVELSEGRNKRYRPLLAGA